MLSKTEKAQIVRLMQSAEWKCVEHLVHNLVEKWKDEQVIHETEWDTIKATLEREGRIRGLQLFSQEIYNCLKDIREKDGE